MDLRSGREHCRKRSPCPIWQISPAAARGDLLTPAAALRRRPSAIRAGSRTRRQSADGSQPPGPGRFSRQAETPVFTADGASGQRHNPERDSAEENPEYEYRC